MKTILITLGLSMLVLSSCGNETQKVEKKEGYMYVEIEECMIPIPDKFKELPTDDEYKFSYFDDDNYGASYSIWIYKRDKYSQNSIEQEIEEEKKRLEESKSTSFVSQFKKNNFVIVKSKLSGAMGNKNVCMLFGKKSNIFIINSNKEELNYLLDYCKKTWKLNKGEQ